MYVNTHLLRRRDPRRFPNLRPSDAWKLPTEPFVVHIHHIESIHIHVASKCGRIYWNVNGDKGTEILSPNTSGREKASDTN